MPISLTVKDFYEHRRGLFEARYDPLPAGEHRVYRVFRGRLTRIPIAEMGSQELTKDYIVVFGTYDEDPETEEALAELEKRELAASPFWAKDFLESVEKRGIVPFKGQQDAATKSENLAVEASTFTVNDLASYDKAGEMIKDIKTMAKEIGATFDPMIEKAHQAHKEALAQKAKFIRPLQEAEKALKAKMAEWYQAEQTRNAQKQKEADAARSREIEEERQKREEAISRMMAEREAEIEAALASGDEEKARELGEKPIMVEELGSPVVPAFHKFTVPKLPGVSARKKYRAEVVDFAALVKGAAANPAFLGYLQANQSALNAIATATKGKTQIPGVEIREEVIMGVRS